MTSWGRGTDDHDQWRRPAGQPAGDQGPPHRRPPEAEQGWSSGSAPDPQWRDEPAYQYPQTANGQAYQQQPYNPPPQRPYSYPQPPPQQFAGSNGALPNPWPNYGGAPGPAAPSPAPKTSLWASRRAKAIGGAIGAILLTLLGVGAAYLVAPSQEVASQEAVEQHQRQEDARNAPVSVEDVFGQSDDKDGPNVASEDVVDLDGKTIPSGGETGSTDDPARLLSSPVPLGDAVTSDGKLTSGAKNAVDFTLTGRQNSPTRIRDMRVKVTERSDAPKGTLIFYPPQGNIPDLKLGFDLDSADTSARTLDDHDMPSSSHYFRENTVTLAKGESIGFNAVVTTSDCACKYVVEIEFSDGRTLQIDNNGKPFFLAAYRDDAERIYTVQYRPNGSSSSTAVLTRCPSMDACAKIAYQQASG